ncbi:MAG: alpha/beta hydrolase [Aphanocapsa sp. GSE-SYN-MK-11-07L]|jgi:pimeloyl-ACP methyl ester carboxylesterase|nr:alpha/beta hydrolase [Aphanocapsa sp. GSE-SYN-MK-11-07L]
MGVLNSGWQHQFIQTNKIRLHCVTQGEGDLVILLHGFPEFWYAWRFQLPILSRYFKVVVPDLRGYNDSDKPSSGYDLDTLSADVVGLIEALGYQQAHIVGHDCGGLIAWHLAQKFPEYVQRLAVLNAPHPTRLVRDLFGNLEQLLQSWQLLALQVPALPEYLIQQNLKNFLQDWFQRHSIRKGAFSSETIQIYQSALEKAGTLSAAISSYRQLLSPKDWLPNLVRRPQLITAPTLVLWGEEDTVVSPLLAEGLDRLISAPFRLRLLSECGHWAQQEVPSIVNQELLDFLRQGLNRPYFT